MAKRVKDARMDSPAARERLRVQGKPYFTAIGPGLHLGYRKGKTGGRWVVRLYRGGGAYRVETLEGLPDDKLTADGKTVLDFWQAQARAREAQQEALRSAAGLESEDAGPYTVRRCMADYLAWLEDEGKPTRDATYRIDALINPELGDTECAKLTAKQIRDWLTMLAKQPPRARTRDEAEKQNYRDFDPSDREAKRRRKSSANRSMTVLKAALNRAWRNDRIPSDAAWRKAEPFKKVDAARARYLSVQEAKRLINACPEDFQELVRGALATGARYGELTALNVSDFDRDNGQVHIRTSKTGDGRFVVLNEEGVALFDRLTTGRPHDAAIFTKSTGQRWLRSHQGRPMADACKAAKINPPISFHGLRHSYASLSIMAGATLQVVAQNLGHSDTRMVERHYGHLARKHVIDMVRATAPSFGIKEESNVQRIQG